MIYVMSDVHGCMDEFKKMLEKIHFSDNDMLYIIGDVVDRGPRPIELLQYIMKHKNMELLMGNHEDMMLSSMVSPYLDKEEMEALSVSQKIQSNRQLWVYHNGGYVTAQQYNELTGEERHEIYDYLVSLDKVKEFELNDEKYLFIHGAPDPFFEESMKRGNYSTDVLWERIERWDIDKDLIPGYEIIVGHTPTYHYGQQYEGKIINNTHKYLIDCGCVFGYALGCLCLDTKETYYIENEEG